MQSQYLSRAEAAEFLTSRGLAISKNTLQKFASIGGGPTFRKFGNRALYTEADLIKWAESRLSEPHSNTSEVAVG